MADVEIVLNRAGMAALLHDPGVQRAVARVADAIASAAEAAAGPHTVTTVVDGESVGQKVPVDMRRTAYLSGRALDDDSRTRARSAVLVSHPTGTGREAGMRALLASMDAGRSAL